MSRNPNRVQRYRLTYEFVLKDRGDYAYIRQDLEKILRQHAESRVGFAADYLAIEKVSEAKS